MRQTDVCGFGTDGSGALVDRSVGCTTCPAAYLTKAIASSSCTRFWRERSQALGARQRVKTILNAVFVVPEAVISRTSLVRGPETGEIGPNEGKERFRPGRTISDDTPGQNVIECLRSTLLRLFLLLASPGNCLLCTLMILCALLGNRHIWGGPQQAIPPPGGCVRRS